MGVLAVLLHEENLYFSEDHLNEIYEKTALMAHRGQRNSFYHNDQIAFGCQTKAPLAEQPFQFQNDRYTLIFDGTIYNLSELRNHLIKAGYSFETKMETEVIAKLFLHKRSECFSLLRGSFAILIWDQEIKTLYGARDQFGIKPLYYMQSDEETIFASEKKSTLFACYEERIDDYAFHQYLDHKYVPEPYTMTRGIRKVHQGHYFVKKMNQPIVFHRFFQATFQPRKSKQANVTKRVGKALYESVDARLNGTRSNGILFSNNIYSPILASFAKQIDPNIKIFSVQLEQQSKNNLAKAIANHLDVEHHFIVISPDQFITALPEIIWMLDDPFADLSDITTYFAATLAKEHVSSVVSSVGADSVFGEIDQNEETSHIFTRIPEVFQRLTRRVQGMLRKDHTIEPVYGLRDSVFTSKEKRQLLKRIITEESIQEKLLEEVEAEHPVIQKQYIDLHSDLPANRLCQVEKLTSAHSLQLHLPFLDKQLFSVLRTIPVQQKTDNEIAKNILQSVLSKDLTTQLLAKESPNFTIPIDDWLRDEYYFWAKQLIAESETDYLFDKEIVVSMLERHVHLEGNNAQQLWTILVFMLWHQIYIEGKFAFSNQIEAKETLLIKNP